MDCSPNRDRTDTMTLPLASTPAEADQESSMSCYLSNLSPIKPVKEALHSLGCVETDFSNPSSVFTSPQTDLTRKICSMAREKLAATGSDVNKDSGSNQLNVLQVPKLEKEVQSSGPSSDYLVDHVKHDSAKSADELQPAIDSGKILKGDFVGKEENVKGIGDGVVVNKFDEFLMQLQLASEYQETEMNLNPILELQHCERYADQHTGGAYNGQLDTSHLRSESSQKVKKNEVLIDGPIVSSGGSFLVAAQPRHETQRYLEYQDVFPRDGIGTCNSSFKEPHDTMSLDTLLKLDCPNITNSEGVAKECSKNTASSSQPFYRLQPTRSYPESGNFDYFGFDLHPIGDGRPVSMSSGFSPDINFLTWMYMKEHEPRETILGRDLNISIAPCPDVYSNQLHCQAALTTTYATTPSTVGMNSTPNSLNVTVEEQAAPPEGMTSLDNSDRVDEINNLSPRKKKKKTNSTSDNKDSKHCNCRRSKCLKLYCECFASGLYCVDSCACIECYNKSDYEDTIWDTREQIESRNPLAFAPKVVKPASNSPINVAEEVNGMAPFSARHKRGCKCKKSKCLKKYCECFQARVGCTPGCGCEGCQNSYGKNTVKSQDMDESAATQLSMCNILADVGNLAPSSHPCTGVTAPSSTSPCLTDYTREQYQLESSHLPASSLPWQVPPINEMPQTPSESLLSDSMEDDETYKLLAETWTPEDGPVASSPNHKCVSSPLHESNVIGGSSSSKTLPMQPFPSFPSLTPSSETNDSAKQDHS